MGRFQRRLREQDAVVGHNSDTLPVQVSEARHHRRPVAFLELMEAATVDQSRNDLL